MIKSRYNATSRRIELWLGDLPEDVLTVTLANVTTQARSILDVIEDAAINQVTEGDVTTSDHPGIDALFSQLRLEIDPSEKQRIQRERERVEREKPARGRRVWDVRPIVHQSSSMASARKM